MDRQGLRQLDGALAGADQPLQALAGCGRRETHGLGQLDAGRAAVILQHSKQAAIGSIQHGIFLYLMVIL